LSKFLLPLAIIVMIFSYQNCGDGFNPALLQENSSSGGSLGDPGIGSGGGDGDVEVEVPFDYTKLRLEVDSLEATQGDIIPVQVNKYDEDLDIRFYLTCSGEQESRLDFSAACQSGYACAEAVCEKAGSANITAKVLSKETGQELFIGSSLLDFKSREKTWIPGGINIIMPSDVFTNTNVVAKASIDTANFKDSDEVSWSVSNGCSVSRTNGGELERYVYCTQNGSHSISVNISNDRSYSSSTVDFTVGSKNKDIDLIVPTIRVGAKAAEIKVADLDVDVDGFKWSLDDSSSCSLKETQTLGIQNLITCGSMPSDGNVNVSVEIVDSNFTGKASKSVIVKKGTLSITRNGAGASKTNKDFNLEAVVKIGTLTRDAKDFNFNWSVCYGPGESAKTKNVDGNNTWTSGNACTKAGEKIFSVSVSNADYAGSASKKVLVSEPVYRYEWQQRPSFNRNVTLSCRGFELPSCSKDSVGNSRECCEFFGSGDLRKAEINAIDRDKRYCEESKKYVCTAVELEGAATQ
jgi:hypothetical protein